MILDLLLLWWLEGDSDFGKDAGSRADAMKWLQDRQTERWRTIPGDEMLKPIWAPFDNIALWEAAWLEFERWRKENSPQRAHLK